MPLSRGIRSGLEWSERFEGRGRFRCAVVLALDAEAVLARAQGVELAPGRGGQVDGAQDGFVFESKGPPEDETGARKLFLDQIGAAFVGVRFEVEDRETHARSADAVAE